MHRLSETQLEHLIKARVQQAHQVLIQTCPLQDPRAMIEAQAKIAFGSWVLDVMARLAQGKPIDDE